MRILLASGHRVTGQHTIGGVQSWIDTVARCLMARGHDVLVSGPKGAPGMRAKFDIGILAHARRTAVLSALCRRVAWISHGVIAEEEPPKGGKIFYTSEDVRDRWARAGGVVVRQPIDLSFWTPSEERRSTLVFYSYRAPDACGLDNLADALGLEFRWLKDAKPEQARATLRGAALVCASGRAALEAMACGAPTLILDHRPYNGGPLVEPDLEKAMRANYSGRGGFDPASIDLVPIARAAMATQFPRAYVAEHHDVEIVADEMLAQC